MRMKLSDPTTSSPHVVHGQDTCFINLIIFLQKLGWYDIDPTGFAFWALGILRGHGVSPTGSSLKIDGSYVDL